MGDLAVHVESNGTIAHVAIRGDVDEHADLAALDSLDGAVQLDLSGVRRFNSMGARLWIDAMRRLTARAHVSCVDCSVAVVQQLNMISGFVAHASVKSFRAPMRCDSCEHEVLQCCAADDVRAADAVEPIRCPRCGLWMELDEPEDAFLLFIREPTKVG